MKPIIYILILILTFSVFTFGQIPTTTTRYFVALPSPNTCVSSGGTAAQRRKQSLIYVSNVGLYKCVNNTYVLAEGSGSAGGGEPSLAESSEFSSLENAVSTIGANKVVVNMTGNLNCSTAVTIPATMELKPMGGTINSSAVNCVVSFAGIGLTNPMSDEPIFSGFAPPVLQEPNTATPVTGPVRWTGAKYPRDINSRIFANTSLSERMNLTDAGFIGKQVTIHVSSGEIDIPIVTSTKRHIRIHGTLTNIESAYYPPSWTINDDTWVQGDGMGATVVYDSYATANFTEAPALFYASSIGYRGSSIAARRRNQNITISDMTIRGSRLPPYRFLPSTNPPSPGDPYRTDPYLQDGTTLAAPGDQEQSAVWLGNVKNGRIERIHFDHVPGFAAYVGIDASADGFLTIDPNSYAENCIIKDNIFDNVGTQAAGAIVGDGLIMQGNQFIDSGYWNYSSQYSNFIDLEPNSRGSRMRHVKIIGNTFNAIGRDTRRFMSAIFVQGASGVKDITIEGNTISGTLLPYGSDRTNADGPNVDVGYSTCIHVQGGESINIINNTVTGCGNAGIELYNSSDVVVANNPTVRGSILVTGLYDSVIRDNNQPKRNDWEYPFANNAGFTMIGGDTGQIVESEGIQDVNVVTTGGVSTATASVCEKVCGLFLHMIGRTFYLSGGGVNAGFYKFSSINEDAQTGVLVNIPTNGTTPVSGTAGNGTASVLRGKANNNHYINNFGSQYQIPADSKSTVSDNTNGQPVYFYNAFVSGDLVGPYTIGDLNIGRKTYFNIVSIEANSRTTPGTCTTPPVFRVIGTGDAPSYAAVILDLSVTAAANSVQGNIFTGRIDQAVLLKLETGAAGCTGTIPKDYNVSIGYQTGVKITRATAINPIP